MCNKVFIFIWLLMTLLLPTADSAHAQQAKIPPLGFLIASSAPVQKPHLEAFRQGLQALGYVEDKSILIDYRYAEGKPERLPALTAELLQLHVDIIVAAGGSPAAQAAKRLQDDPHRHDQSS